MTARIGDLGQSRVLGTLLLQTQARVREAQVDIASGVRAQRWDEIADRARLLVAARDERAVTEQFLAQNDQVASRIAAMDSALRGIGEIAERLRTVLVAHLGEPGKSAIPLEVEAEQMAQEVAALLNRQLDGRFLFAGSRTAAPPVALPDPLPTTADPTLYYRSDTTEPSVRAARDVELTYGVTAAAAPFAQLFAALGQAHDAHLADDRAGLEQALAHAAAAIEGLAEERGRLAVAGARLESIADGQRGAVLYLDELIHAIAETDLAEAAARLARDQAALEASYLVVARLNQLSLAEYLR